MVDIPDAPPLKELRPNTSMDTRIYVDHCRVTNTTVLSMYNTDCSRRLFSVPIRDLQRIAEAYERGRELQARGRRHRGARKFG